jgi:hypothetical protein
MTKRLDYNQIAPNGAKALGGVYGYAVQGGLPGELVELVYLRHTHDLIKKGVKVEKLNET